jgi:hypothetical protein
MNKLSMKFKFLFAFIISLLLTGCSAKISSNFYSQEKPLSNNEKVAFLDINHIVPENAKKIGKAKFGDSGFSTDCNFNSNLIKAREIARKNGANIVKVIENKTPDFSSFCHRMKLEFYYYDGNVSDLKQYKLQIN